MKKKPNPPARVIQDHVTQKSQYQTWGDDEASRTKAMEAFGEFNDALDEYGVVQRANASYRSGWRYDFTNIDTNVNAKSPFTRSDYDYYRPDEAIPDDIKCVMEACDQAYRWVGIVRNVIDLMSDFACEGISIVHPNEEIQKFYRAWFEKVGGPAISEQFLNNLYRVGNVVVSRQMAQLNESKFKKLKKLKGKAKEQQEVNFTYPNKKNEIPWSYTFLNVLDIDVISTELSTFVGAAPQLGLKISSKLKQAIKNPKTEADRLILENLPDFYKNQLATGKMPKYILLDPFLVTSHYYKKKDWQEWADPMIAAILDNINVLEKMRLTDLAALDGAISHIRHWKLGNLEFKIAPNKALLTKISNMLSNNPGGGTVDIFTGPDVEMVESKSDLHQFLGEAKYAAPLTAIFQGLGIPPTLTGNANASGTTNNFVSLKTLVKRLEYGRAILKSFWQRELEIIRQARGFRFPAEVHFERMVLSDEVAEKALLRDLWDRGLISDETILARFGELPNIERIRGKKEEKQRQSGLRVKKASPWHNPQPEHEYKKIALQSGIVTPSEVGLELVERKSGEIPLIDKQMEAKKQQMAQKKTGVPGQGRPKNSTDKKKRKSRTVKPRSRANEIELQIWASNTQKTISDIVTPLYLTKADKKNLRQLSVEEFQELEHIKFAILCSINQQFTSDDIITLYNNIPQIPERVYDNYTRAMATIKKPTVDNLRQVQAIVYTQEKMTNG